MSARIKPVDPREFAAPAPPNRVGGHRPPKLSITERKAVIERYRQHRENHPDRICAAYGISRSTLRHIVGGHRYSDEAGS